MPVFYPDNTNRGNRVQMLVDDIADCQARMKTYCDQMDTATAQTVQNLQTFMKAAGASTLDEVIAKLNAQMTPEQQQAYKDMITFNQQFGDITDTIMQASSLVFAVAAIYRIAFNLTAFSKTVGAIRVIKAYVSGIKILVTEGYDAGMEVLKAVRAGAKVVIGEFTETSGFTKVLGVAAEVSDWLMIIGVAVDGIILILQAIEGAEQKTKLIEAIHQAQIARLSSECLYTEAVAITAHVETFADFAKALAKHGSITDPVVQELGGDIAETIAGDQAAINILTTEQGLEKQDANRGAYRDDDLSTDSVVAGATTDIDVLAGGTYQIVNAQTGTLMDLTGLNTAPGTLINGYQNNGGDNQKWIVTPTDNINTFSIKCKYGGVFASHVQATTTSPYYTLQASNTEDDWIITSGTQDGVYYIRSASTDTNFQGRVLDMANASAANETQIILQTVNNPQTLNQQWKFVATS